MMPQQPHNSDSGIKPEIESPKPPEPGVSTIQNEGSKTAKPAEQVGTAGRGRDPVPPPRTRTKPSVGLSPEAQFPVAQRMPVQVFIEESRGQRLSHWGPTVTAGLSLVLAAVVGIGAIKLSRQQIDLQKQQADLEAEQAKAQLADMRFKFLNDVTAKEENKKVSAELGLAAHGHEAMPVVHFALGVEQSDIRRSAVDVFYRMFQAAPSFKDRNELLQELMDQISSPNKTLHTGIVQGLVKVGPLLNGDERQKAIAFLREKVPPQSECAKPEGRATVKEAATFFWARDANSIPYLLTIAHNAKCGDGWLQAMLKLEEVASRQPDRRAELINAIGQIKTEVLNTLRNDISDEDFVNGGFGEFINEGQVEVKFADFKRRVEDEFNRLSRFLENQ